MTFDARVTFFSVDKFFMYIPEKLVPALMFSLKVMVIAEVRETVFIIHY